MLQWKMVQSRLSPRYRARYVDDLFRCILVLSEQNGDMPHQRDNFSSYRGSEVLGDRPSLIQMVLETDLHQLVSSQCFIQSMRDAFVASLLSDHDHRLELVSTLP